jgi:hypothetical protein
MREPRARARVVREALDLPLRANRLRLMTVAGTDDGNEHEARRGQQEQESVTLARDHHPDESERGVADASDDQGGEETQSQRKEDG